MKDMKNMKMKNQIENGQANGKVKRGANVQKETRAGSKNNSDGGPQLIKGTFVDLKSDFGIKRIFGHPKGKTGLIRMLNTLLTEEIPAIKDIVYQNTDEPDKLNKQKDSSEGFSFIDDQNRYYELEVQKHPIDSIISRIFVKSCGYHSEAIEKANFMKFDQPPIIEIIITDFDIPELDSKDCISVIQFRDRSNGLVSIDATMILAIQLSKFRKNVHELKSEKDCFLYLLANMEKLNEIPSELDNEIYRPLFEMARFANFSDEEMKEFIAAHKIE